MYQDIASCAIKDSKLGIISVTKAVSCPWTQIHTKFSVPGSSSCHPLKQPQALLFQPNSTQRSKNSAFHAHREQINELLLWETKARKTKFEHTDFTSSHSESFRWEETSMIITTNHEGFPNTIKCPFLKSPFGFSREHCLPKSTHSTLTDALQTWNFSTQCVIKSQFLAGHLEVNHNWHRPILSAFKFLFYFYNIQNIVEHTQHTLATFLTEAF